MPTVITGGQTGVDTGALRAAIEVKVGAKTIMPLGHKREEPAPKWLLDIAECTDSGKYDARTKAVIKRCQACIVIAPSINNTPGTILTVRLAKDEGLQLWVFDSVNNRAVWNAEAHAMAYWIKQMERHCYPSLSLMVAGPRGSKWRAGEADTLSIMVMAFKHYKELK